MRAEYLHERMDREDREREERYLENLGVIGRLFDNHLYFCIVFAILALGGFNIGFLIGMML